MCRGRQVRRPRRTSAAGVRRLGREARVSFYTDWFLAEEGDAKAVASIVTTEEHSFEDWPHLSLKGIGAMDLSTLWGVLRGRPDSLDSATGNLLTQEADEVFVCRVEPGFIEALAAVKAAGIKRLAAEWNTSEELADWGAAEVESVVRALVKFAGRAKREGKPVLQLSVL